MHLYDEHWFILVHVQIEALAAEILAAIGSLAEAGISVSFIRWMALATPAMVVLLLVAWQLLTRMFPASVERISLTSNRASIRQLRPGSSMSPQPPPSSCG